MKILNRKDFLAMPPGTLFQKIDQYGNMDRLMIKYDTWTNDFLCEDVAPLDVFGPDFYLPDPPEAGHEVGQVSRDGLYDENQKFVVWSRDDAKKMVDYVTEKVLTEAAP